MSEPVEEPRRLETSWDAVVLVCGACRKRGSGPRKSKAEVIVEALRAGSKGLRPRPRLVTTGCLGPCPRKAVTVALPGANGTPARVWAVASAGEARFVAREIGGPGASSDRPGTPKELLKHSP